VAAQAALLLLLLLFQGTAGEGLQEMRVADHLPLTWGHHIAGVAAASRAMAGAAAVFIDCTSSSSRMLQEWSCCRQMGPTFLQERFMQ
jgi:hypothetical protein